MTLNLFHQLNSFIQFYFVQAGAAGLKNQISKTNQPYDAQPCWLLLFSPLHFIGIFFPSFAPEVAAFSPQGSPWTGPDVPGSTLPHSLPHGIFMGNQAPQHSTAQYRAAQTRDHLFINFIALLLGWLRHNNSSAYKRIFSPFRFSQTTSSFPFNWHRSHGYIN